MKKLLQRARHGFTLIELLVVITIIGILAAMLFPVFGRIREQAYRVKCASDLKQIGMGIAQYYDDFESSMPTGSVEGIKALSNYVGNAAQLFACPSDTRKACTNGLSNILVENISYNYAPSNVWQSTTMTPIFWDRGVSIPGGSWPVSGSPHKADGGNILWTDGHVGFEKLKFPTGLNAGTLSPVFVP
jgi:prepilin-type N-terminal cleavage/methylation domain-containing protein/prepilin-type processing-associated H-X9-DG protein